MTVATEQQLHQQPWAHVYYCLAKVDSGHSKEKNTTVSTSTRNYGCCVVEVDSGHKKMKRDNSFKSNYGCCVVEVDSLLRRGRETTVTTSTRVAV